MKRRRLAAAGGAAVLVLALWAIRRAGRAPATGGLVLPSRPTASYYPAPRPAAEAAPVAAGELAAPEPALAASARRRFSSPSGAGAADGDAPAVAAEAAAAARLSGGGAVLPGGMAVPSAGGWASFPGEPARERRAAKDGDSAPGASSPSPGASAPSPKAESDAKPALGGAAGGLVSAAKTLKAAAAGQRDRLGLEKGLLAQVALDQKVDDRLRPALAALRASGQDTPANVSRAARAALAASGQDAAAEDEEEVSAAVARASAPPAPPAKPEALQEAARAIAEAPPLSLQEREEVRRLAMNPPPPTSPTVPTGPPPKSAMDAYAKHEGVFDKAEKDFGVKPEHILGILGVETRWGGNTGKFPLVGTLRDIAARVGPDGRPTRAAKQAGKDLVALTRLEARGDLGPRTAADIRGSYAGAMGIPQFLPSSWEHYARSPDGGKRDPFHFPDAAYSVGSYLSAHGYKRDVARSIFGYNHSQEYVDKVLGLSANVKAGLDKKDASSAKP